MTELLSSKFRFRIVSNKVFLESVGFPSVRNKMTLFLFFPQSSEAEPFSNSNAFSKAGMNLVRPVKQIRVITDKTLKIDYFNGVVYG